MFTLKIRRIHDMTRLLIAIGSLILFNKRQSRCGFRTRSRTILQVPVQTFMNRLATRFTEFSSATYAGLTAASLGGGNDNCNATEFGTTGFQRPFFEDIFIDDSGRVLYEPSSTYCWGTDCRLPHRCIRRAQRNERMRRCHRSGSWSSRHKLK